MDPKKPNREEDEQKTEEKKIEPEREGIDENRRAKELEDVEEVVGPQPGGGEETGHS